MPKRTYIDANVLIAAIEKDTVVARRAIEILGDPDRVFVISDAILLEVLPKPFYEKRQKAVYAYSIFFNQAEHLEWCIDTLHHAYDLAKKYGLGAMDAIHIATALDASADEFITAEKDTKPMFRVTELRNRMRSIG